MNKTVYKSTFIVVIIMLRNLFITFKSPSVNLSV